MMNAIRCVSREEVYSSHEKKWPRRKKGKKEKRKQEEEKE